MSDPEIPAKNQAVYQSCDQIRYLYKNPTRSALSQIVVTLIQNWLLIGLGMQLTMPTLVLAALHNKPEEDLCMNDAQASWFGSILFFSHPIGSVISGFLQEQFGRKGSMVLVNVPIFAAWTTLYFSSSVYNLYFVSLTMGLCTGFSEAPLHSYIGEIGEPHLRGTLSTISSSAYILGILIEYIIGYFVHWRTAALISSILPVITFVTMTQIPESPTWLIMKGRLEEAQKSLSWIRGWVPPEEVQNEFQALISYTRTHEINKQQVPGKGNYEIVPTNENEKPLVETKERYLKTKFKEMTDKKLLIPLRFVFIIFIFSHATSLIGMKPFMVGILNEFGFPFNSKLILIINGASFFSGAMLNVVFLRRLGKRRITLLCQTVSTLSILLLGVYCSIFDRSNRIQSLTWIPIITMINIFFFSGFSLALLPWQLISEVFPVQGRGAAGGISAAWACYVAFVMSKSYLYLERWVKLSGVMWVYGSISLAGLWFYWKYLPETEGKSLEKIETYFTLNHDEKEKFSKPKNYKR